MTRDFRAALAQHGPQGWWSAGMRQITWAMLGSVRGRVLDVGCGPGWELAELPKTAWGVGLDLYPLIGARPRAGPPKPMVQGDASHLPFAAETFDLVLALDLLEQRDLDPSAVLGEMRRVLRPGGRLMARVPAHPWLSGPHDTFWGGSRRYRHSELAVQIREAGFTVRRLTYANTLLFPVAVASRLAARAGLLSGDDLRLPPRPLSGPLLAILRLEARWLRTRDLPTGLSLLCLAERTS